MLVPIILLAIAPAAAAQPVSLAYAQQRNAAGVAVHDRQTVTVTGVASVGSDPHAEALQFFIQDRGTAPYGLSLYTSRIRIAIHAGDLVTATGRLGVYASMVELRPDELRVVGRTAPPAPIDVPAEQLAGWRWAGVLVRTRAKIDSVAKEEDYADMRLATSRGPLTAHIGAAQLKSFDLARFVNGETVEVTGIASEYKRRTSPAVDWEILPRSASDLKIVRRSRAALWATLGVALVAAALIGAAVFFSRPQKLRPEHYP